MQSAEEKSVSSWSRFLEGVFDVGGADAEVGFVARANGRFILSETSAPSHRLERSTGAIARGHADGFIIRFQLDGAMSGRMGDRTVEICAGDIVFIDLLQTFDLQTTAKAQGACDVSLWVPRGRMLAALGRDDALHGLVLSGASPAGAMISGGLRVLAQQAKSIPDLEMDALCDGLVALAAKALGPALASPRAVGMSPAAAFVTIRRYIDRNLRSPALDAERLADTFGVSRASLYRLFEPVGGVASYIRKARLARAYQEIAACDFSSRRIGPIAYALGFKNVSTFNRAFKDYYGVSPREARARAVAPDFTLVPHNTGTIKAHSLACWLAQIDCADPARGDRENEPATQTMISIVK